MNRVAIMGIKAEGRLTQDGEAGSVRIKRLSRKEVGLLVKMHTT